MRTVKILIIGNADSIWVKEYCKKVLIPVCYSVDILSKNNARFEQYYQKNNVNVIKIDCPVVYNHLGKGKFFRYIKNLFVDREYDVVHVQFSSRYNLRIANMLRKKCRYIVATFWGSDLLRSNRLQHVEMFLYLRRTKDIILLTDNMLEYFKNTILKIFLKKTKVLDFGVSNLSTLNQLNGAKEREKCKEILNFPIDKYIIGIGYNRSKGQQHLEVLEAMYYLPESIRNRCHFVLQMTYGEKDNDYLAKIQELLKTLQVGYSVFDNYMTDEDVCFLRNATDIYINAQITDALAATINEYLYSETIVINPTWVNYSELDNLGMKYISYASINELPAIIEKIIMGELEISDLEFNRKQIWNAYSWEVRKDAWLALYNG